MGSEWNGVKSEGGMDCKMGTDSWGDVDKVWGLVLMVLVPPLYGYLCLLLQLPGTPTDGWGTGDRRAAGEHRRPHGAGSG